MTLKPEQACLISGGLIHTALNKLSQREECGDNKALTIAGQSVYSMNYKRRNYKRRNYKRRDDKRQEDKRREDLARWARQQTALFPGPIQQADELLPVSDDASFRRYFRFQRKGGLDPAYPDTYPVFVDAPPEHEDNPSFINISSHLIAAGINAPKVLAADLENGFLAISDLGNDIYLQTVLANPSGKAALYDDAVSTLVRLQQIHCDLPHYDEPMLRREMALFPEWFLGRQLGIQLSISENTLLEDVMNLLVQNAVTQPQVFVHRDYHSRNLMVGTRGSPGVLDFQDAVIGPVTYDLVSLLKDCYYRFDRAEVVARVSSFRGQLQASGVSIDASDVAFLRWFDLMGLQRHLKCAGIFCRLHLRDNKPRYLADIPLVVSYINQVCELYCDIPALDRLGNWLSRHVTEKMLQPPFNPGATNPGATNPGATIGQGK